jgi:predicted flap endonuclease-1-like 5' DNA nuclease
MFRRLVSFSAAAFLGALLVWLWNRYNEDLLEEDLEEEEIPLEFDVAAEDGPTLEPVNIPTDGATDAGVPATTAAADETGAESSATDETNTPAVEEVPAESDASTEDGTPDDAARETDTATAASAEADATEDTSPVEATTSAETGGTAEDEESDEDLMLDSAAPTPEGAGDNVIAIKVIGPKYGAKLAEMGITTFGALIATPMTDLEVAFPRVSTEELQNWLEQARELAAQDTETA